MYHFTAHVVRGVYAIHQKLMYSLRCIAIAMAIARYTQPDTSNVMCHPGSGAWVPTTKTTVVVVVVAVGCLGARAPKIVRRAL